MDFLETADCMANGNVMELFDIFKTGNMETASSANKELIKNAIPEAKEWLPFASEEYNISADLKDYVIVPVTVMYSDLPNRNLASFPFEELTRFSAETGRVAYKSWQGMPTYYEHNNSDPTKAKGIVLDAALRALSGYQGNLFKVVTLLAFDRNRDAELASNIITGKLSTYSMGAWCQTYTCSCCGTDLRTSNGRCAHIDLRNKKAVKYDETGKLAHRCSRKIRPFEVSCVGIPAFSQAQAAPIAV